MSPLTYNPDLKTVGIVVGLLLIAAHAVAFLKPQVTQTWLKALPRSNFWGIAILAIDAVWAWFLVRGLDMGEFSAFQRPLLILIPIAFYLTIRYVDEFLAARALGILCLLAAEPLLCAAFLKPQTSRLLLVVLAYVWIVAGMFWIGMPYLLRDQIGWVQQTMGRWKAAAFAGLLYGLAILTFAFTSYGKADASIKTISASQPAVAPRHL